MDALLSSFLLFCAVFSVRTEAPTVDPLNAIIEDKERIVSRIAAKSLEAFSGECPNNCSECALLSCGSLLPESGAQCRMDYGAQVVQASCEKDCTNRRLNFRKSTIRTASPIITEQVITEECLTKNLVSVFIDNQEKDSLSQMTLRWQYIGTPSGFSDVTLVKY